MKKSCHASIFIDVRAWKFLHHTDSNMSKSYDVSFSFDLIYLFSKIPTFQNTCQIIVEKYGIAFICCELTKKFVASVVQIDPGFQTLSALYAFKCQIDLNFLRCVDKWQSICTRCAICIENDVENQTFPAFVQANRSEPFAEIFTNWYTRFPQYG